MDDESLESFIKMSMANITALTYKLEQCWNNPVHKAESDRIRATIIQQGKDLSVFLDMWNYRQQSMR